MKTMLSIVDKAFLKPIENFLDQEGGVPMFHQKRGMNPLVAGLIGLAIGATGTAVGFAMTDPKTRKMVADKAKNLTNWGNDKMQGVRQSATRMLNSMQDSTEDLKKKTPKSESAKKV